VKLVQISADPPTFLKDFKLALSKGTVKEYLVLTIKYTPEMSFNFYGAFKRFCTKRNWEVPIIPGFNEIQRPNIKGTCEVHLQEL